MRRLASLVVVAALAGALVVVGGGQVASAQTGPIGYTVGSEILGFDSCQFWSIDLSSGALTQISSSTTDCADGLTFAPDGTLYAYTNEPIQGIVTDANLVTIDLATGAQTVVGALPPVRLDSGGMTFDAAGNLWLFAHAFDPVNPPCEGPDVEAVCLWQVDPATAEATPVEPAPEGVEVTGLTASCVDGVLAMTRPFQNGFPGNNSAIQSVDTATGGLTLVRDLPDVSVRSTGLDFDAGGELWALTVSPAAGFGGMEVDNIDLATGDVTHQQLFIDGDLQNPFQGFLFGLAVDPVACPVPPPAPDAVVIQPTFTG